jgi:hypothetical protein
MGNRYLTGLCLKLKREKRSLAFADQQNDVEPFEFREFLGECSEVDVCPIIWREIHDSVDRDPDFGNARTALAANRPLFGG